MLDLLQLADALLAFGAQLLQRLLLRDQPDATLLQDTFLLRDDLAQVIDLGELREPVVEFDTRAGELRLVPEPAGTRGYDDLRRHAERQPLGEGVRPSVASPGDLARMLGALEREHEIPILLRLRRLIELDRGRGLYLER